jgi:hypothetical protein
MRLYKGKAWGLLLLVALGYRPGVLETLGAESSGAGATNEIRVLQIEGTVLEVLPSGATAWYRISTGAVLHASDRIRTGPNTRATLRWSNQSVVPMDALTELEILPPHEPKAQFGLNLLKGVISFFHRDEPGRIRAVTRGVTAGVEGTEFVLAVAGEGLTEKTTLYVIDGKVRLTNAQGTLLLINGEQAVTEVGSAPLRTVGFIANNVLQWCFYYPAVLDLLDLPLDSSTETALAASLDAYRSGDLLAALRLYPAGREPGSDAEKIYYAELLLSVGQVARTETVLSSLPRDPATGRVQRLEAALRRQIAAVKRQESTSPLKPELATEFLASS